MYNIIFSLLLTYIVVLPLARTPRLPLLAQRIQLSEIVFFFFFFFWIADLIKNKKPLVRDTGLNKPFLFFISCCMLSFLHSSDLFLSTIELSGLLYLFIMFAAVIDVTDGKERLDAIIKVWILTTAVILIWALAGWFIAMITGERNLFCRVYHNRFPYIKNVCRVQSTFRHPQALGNYLIASLGFVFSEFFLTNDKKYKSYLKVMIFFMWLVTFATITKSVLGFAVSFFIIYSHFYKAKELKFKVVKYLLIFLIAVAFCASTFFSSIYVRHYKIENLHKGPFKINIDYSYDVRFAKKIAALEMLKRHPFLGVGLSMYPLYVDKLNKENYFKKFGPIHYYPLGEEGISYLPIGKPHNDILGYLAETGILGGSAFIIFIAVFLHLGFSNLKKTDDYYFKTRLFCFLASFIGIFVDSMDVDVFKLRHLWLLMAVSLALIIHKDRICKVSQK